MFAEETGKLPLVQDSMKFLPGSNKFAGRADFQNLEQKPSHFDQPSTSQMAMARSNDPYRLASNAPNFNQMKLLGGPLRENKYKSNKQMKSSFVTGGAEPGSTITSGHGAIWQGAHTQGVNLKDLAAKTSSFSEPANRRNQSRKFKRGNQLQEDKTKSFFQYVKLTQQRAGDGEPYSAALSCERPMDSFNRPASKTQTLRSHPMVDVIQPISILNEAGKPGAVESQEQLKRRMPVR